MARESFQSTRIPTGVEDVPYPNHRELARGAFGPASSAVMVQGVGAGGAGVDITGIPFEPAYMRISEATGPLLQEQFHLGGAVGAIVGINAITGAAAAADVTVTGVPGTGGNPDTWTLNVPTGVAPDGDTVTILVVGFREGEGSL